MQILIVEDDPDGRENLTDILELDGHQVLGAGNGGDALTIAENELIDTVILDWNLTDLTADQLIPDLQRLQPDTPIIVITGYGDLGLVVEAMRRGVWDYLEKPINVELLKATLMRVAERQENLRELQQVEKRLVESERLAAIGQMVTGLAHESRNAFQRSQACLEVLELNLKDDPENLAIIGKVQDALLQIQKLYEQVRTYAAPIQLELQPVIVTELLESVWEQIIQATGNENVQLKIQTDDPALTLNLDRFRIQQVIRNVLENAIDATQQRDDFPACSEIMASISSREADVVLEVRDPGTGLEESVAGKVFDPFFTTKTRGTGLGLAISKRLVEAHSGSILLESQADGTTARITLPLSKSH